MQGRIWVESAPGKGSRFHFTARFQSAPREADPADRGKEPAAEGLAALVTGGRGPSLAVPPVAVSPADVPAVENPPPRSTSVAILLAEDNPINQKLALRLLHKRGYTVVTAGNGIEALAAFERQCFDVVLMDIQMPEMDGFKATAALRESERGTGQHQLIVAMTAHAMKGDDQRCLEAGMDGYLCKPIRSDHLYALLEGFPESLKSAQSPASRCHSGKALDLEPAGS
jgi:CheY-like chemotaxis protein